MSASGATAAEERVLAALVAVTADGWPASVREVQARSGHASPQSVHATLHRLRELGLAVQNPRRPVGGWLPAPHVRG
jgi:DNA-binding IclR family transcriptional regulator